VITGRLDTLPRSHLCTDSDFSSLPEHQLSHIAHTSRWKKIQDHSSKFFNWGLAFNEKFCHAKIESFSEKIPFNNLESVLEHSPDKKFFFTEDTKKRIKQSVKVGRFFNGVEILYNQKGGARMGYSIFGVSGVAPTLTCTTSRHYERYQIGDGFRRLTNVEYARIQGFPDNHCAVASIYNQYALYGNAVPPQLAQWAVARTLGNNFVALSNVSRQPTLL
ncbi:MAG: DNA cytosine methyltransferase, partial [Candidatus Promineifilaceae bacterium]